MMAIAIMLPHTVVAITQTDLGKVQQAISSAQAQIKNTSTAQKQIGSSLQQTYHELSSAQKQLAELNKQQQVSLRQLLQLQNRLDQTKTKINVTQTQIARLLNAHYRNRHPNSINLLLNQNHIDQKGRTLQYLRYLNQANEQVIKQLQQQQQELKQQQYNLNQHQKQLALLKTKQQTLIKQLNKVQQTQLKQSTQLDQKFTLQTQKLQQLKADEKRMNVLLSRLTTTAARKKLPKQHSLAKNPLPAVTTKIATTSSSLTAEDLALRANDTENIHTTVTFVSQQGQLYRPVNAPVTSHFGSTRPNGGTWKGLFFATSPAVVHSIAQGTVIYATNLQGYGNTIIIDHGDGYLSIYTGLSSIFVHANQSIVSGEVLGKSGQLPDQGNGLYFEIRYHNQPMNPLSWIN